MTIGELALFYNAALGINAPLRVIPAVGWRRAMWYDQTGLPWVRPSPNLPTLTSALVYPSLVAFEASNVSVGRGTSDPFQRFGAPWLNAARVAQLLNERRLPGVAFVVDSFTPRNPGDGKFDGRQIAGVRVDVTDRDKVRSGRVGAAILWAIVAANRDSLQIRTREFDERFGSTETREAILSGTDPDVAIGRAQRTVDTFLRDARRFFLYR
jgi:uncharacterized protein YbbC (DUF1343 family)